MRQKLGRTVSAAWMRGGTSKGLFFNAEALPAAGPSRDRVLLAAMGPDPSGMQINGVGGGISSTSKVVVVNPVSYTHLRAHETPEHLGCRVVG